jgi:polysaccharide deacetylase 2 family uncharacterized protein YibQ
MQNFAPHIVFYLDISPYKLYPDLNSFLLTFNRYDIKPRKRMDRRKFIINSASFLLGSLSGFDLFTRAFACERPEGCELPPPRLALIIDDIGPSVSKARLFAEFGIPMTLAVLPRFPKSEALALDLHTLGHEIMLHQPMEPRDPDIDPGPGALFVGDGPKKIIRVMEENISSLPIATGVNNHMGSRFTAYQKEMHETLQIVKERGLFFVDSLTSSDSKGYQTAQRLHMPAACRNVFLDNEIDVAYILRQLQKLAHCSLRYGHGIGIGHPFPETAEAIGLFLKGLKNSPITFVHASKLALSV